MAYSEEEAEKVKEQLYSQLESFPEEKREALKQRVMEMSPEELEEFIQQNTVQEPQKCIFCSIIDGKIPTYKVDEDSENVAILEINPLSKGHLLVMPKQHLDKITESTQKLAEKIGAKIRERLQPNDIKINQNQVMGHAVLEVIPLFGGEKARKKATESELKELQMLLTKPEEIMEKNIEEEGTAKETIQSEPLPKLRRRIP